MAISKETKEARVEEYQALLETSKAIVLASYSGLTMKQLNDLRARLREIDGTFQIVKNTLLQRALDESGRANLEELLTGTTAVGYLTDNVPTGAKTLLDFAQETQAIQVKGALMGDRVLSAEEVQTISNLPPREVLLATLVARFQSPIYGLVNVLSGPTRALVYALKARQDQLANAAA